MRVVQIDGFLDGNVTDGVTVSEVFCNDTTARLDFLGQFIRVRVVSLVVAAIVVAGAGSAGNLNLRGAKLRIIKKQSRLGSSLLLKLDNSTLCLAFTLNLNRGDLAAVKCEYCSDHGGETTHQKLKKSFTSFSSVCELMFVTLTVLADILINWELNNLQVLEKTLWLWNVFEIEDVVVYLLSWIRQNNCGELMTSSVAESMMSATISTNSHLLQLDLPEYRHSQRVIRIFEIINCLHNYIIHIY